MSISFNFLIRGFATFVTLCALVSHATAQVHFAVVDSIVVGGSGGWDYIAFEGGRLYASHNDEVVVIDAPTKQVKAHIPAHGSHGIAIASTLGKGFISNGKSNTVTAFDLKTDSVITEIKTGEDPDAIAFDSATNRVFAMNGHGESITAIDAKTLEPIETLGLKGSPEFAVADGEGHLFLNIEDKNETIEVDSKKLKILHRWKLEGGDGPTGLSYDKEHHLLFSGCHNKKLFVVNTESGDIVATLPIGEGVDATVYDPNALLAFASNRDGTLDVMREESPTEIVHVESARTAPGAKTMAIDIATQTIYLPTAQFLPAPAPTADKPHPRPQPVPGTFKILIVRAG